jgi:hypothetical protein
MIHDHARGRSSFLGSAWEAAAGILGDFAGAVQPAEVTRLAYRLHVPIMADGGAAEGKLPDRAAPPRARSNAAGAIRVCR